MIPVRPARENEKRAERLVEEFKNFVQENLIPCENCAEPKLRHVHSTLKCPYQPTTFFPIPPCNYGLGYSLIGYKVLDGRRPDTLQLFDVSVEEVATEMKARGLEVPW